MHLGSLDRLLAALHVEIDAFALCDIARDAALAVRPLDVIEVHFVLSGTLYLDVEGAESVQVDAGGMVIVPAGHAQRMAGSPGAARFVDPRAVEVELASTLAHYATGGDVGTRIICGKIGLQPGGSFGLFDGLSHPLHAQLENDPLAVTAFTAMAGECETGHIGGRALTSALMKACLILLLRRQFAAAASLSAAGLSAPAFSALAARPSLLCALLAIVEQPQAAHSVAKLASIAGMSRSGFARAFASSLGTKPMEFVGQARIARARRLLDTTELPVAAVASHAGFASRSHFSRSFRSAFGTDPTSYRHREQDRERA